MVVSHGFAYGFSISSIAYVLYVESVRVTRMTVDLGSSPDLLHPGTSGFKSQWLTTRPRHEETVSPNKRFTQRSRISEPSPGYSLKSVAAMFIHKPK